MVIVDVITALLMCIVWGQYIITGLFSNVGLLVLFPLSIIGSVAGFIMSMKGTKNKFAILINSIILGIQVLIVVF